MSFVATSVLKSNHIIDIDHLKITDNKCKLFEEYCKKQTLSEILTDDCLLDCLNTHNKDAYQISECLRQSYLAFKSCICNYVASHNFRICSNNIKH